MEKAIRSQKHGKMKLFISEATASYAPHYQVELESGEVCDILMYFNEKGPFGLTGYQFLRGDVTAEEFEAQCKTIQRKLRSGDIIFAKVM